MSECCGIKEKSKWNAQTAFISIHPTESLQKVSSSDLNVTEKMNWMPSCKSKQLTSRQYEFIITGEREKKKWAELTRTSTKTIEWACQVWMKYAKCKYCGGIFKLLRHSEFEMAHLHQNTCITLEFIPQIDPTHTRTQGCDATFFSASKWKVLCSVCIYVYSNIHSSWQRQKKTKHKIRLNGFSCWKWSKLRNMWLLHRWKQFLTVRNCVCV